MSQQAIEQLHNNWKQLQAEWARTKSEWNDPVQRRFEQHYWQPYAETMPRIEKELARVVEMSEKAVKNCP